MLMIAFLMSMIVGTSAGAATPTFANYVRETQDRIDRSVVGIERSEARPLSEDLARVFKNLCLMPGPSDFAYHKSDLRRFSIALTSWLTLVPTRVASGLSEDEQAKRVATLVTQLFQEAVARPGRPSRDVARINRRFSRHMTAASAVFRFGAPFVKREAGRPSTDSSEVRETYRIGLRVTQNIRANLLCHAPLETPN